MPKTPSNPRRKHHTPGGILKPRPENAPRRAKCRHHPPKTKPRTTSIANAIHTTPNSHTFHDCICNPLQKSERKRTVEGASGEVLTNQLASDYCAYHSHLYHAAIPPGYKATMQASHSPSALQSQRRILLEETQLKSRPQLKQHTFNPRNTN